MTKNFFVVVFVLLKTVSGFNYSSLDEQDGSNRNGKFLFDSLFGFEEDLLVNDAVTNSLKSCDCGE
jgi:hypothetical protein